MKWWQVLLINTNCSIQHYSFIWAQLNGSKYCYVSLTHQSFVYTQLTDQTVLFLTIQFNLTHLFAHWISNSSIWPKDRTLTRATTPGLSRPGNDGNKRVLRIPQNSSITGASPSYSLMSYQDTRWWGFYPSAEMQWVYSTALTDPKRVGSKL